jgi:pimeloyl-ACP methyl ester carboxylesterase
VPPMDTRAERFDVRSADGTRIAVWRDGAGPPLILVHGSIADHTTFASFVAVLRRSFDTFAVDRRGFGDSGDTPPYALAREFEDVASVTSAVAARTGQPPTLFGHSYGANCALGGASIDLTVDRLVLYEPSLGLRYPSGSIERVELALERGDRDGAIGIVLEETLGLSPEEIAGFRANPLWPRRIAAAPTIPRECRVEDEWVDAPGDFRDVSARTLFLTGSDSPPDVIAVTTRLAARVPRSRVHTLAGHGHFAHRTDPELVAGVIASFVAE